MAQIPLIPENAPFTPEQRSWLNGFLAGWSGDVSQVTVRDSKPEGAPLLILYGSQSGNAESFAKKAGRQMATKGFAPRVLSMEEVKPDALSGETQVLVITSTWGEGEMPDNARDFWEGINHGESPKLDHLKYSVLALGDRNYADTFCYAGRLIDERLEKLGARRIHPRVDCDVEFDEPAEGWLNGVFEKLDPTVSTHAAAVLPVKSETKTEAGYSKKNPFPSALLENRAMNGEGSAKDVRHIAFSLKDSGLEYEVGDALGVNALSDPAVVDELIEALEVESTAWVDSPEGTSVPVREAFIHHYDVTKITPALLKLLSGLGSGGELSDLLGKNKKEELSQYLWGKYPVDLVRSLKPAGLDLKAFTGTLKKLQPRLYSIASSPRAHPGEVHLTVGAVRYTYGDSKRGGLCSTFLADRLALGDRAGVFVQKSHGFRLPENSDLPVIMVGPGTGIAPFRAFLEEREVTGAKGKNWLFFGDQKAATDFLYREQLEGYHSTGVLTKLDTAFSRDQDKKIYVQNRMEERGEELWQWLEDGAHFYVCGDASRMAKDVDAMLHQIVRHHGGLDEDAAKEFVRQLRTNKRYQRDVY